MLFIMISPLLLYIISSNRFGQEAGCVLLLQNNRYYSIISLPITVTIDPSGCLGRKPETSGKDHFTLAQINTVNVNPLHFRKNK